MLRRSEKSNLTFVNGITPVAIVIVYSDILEVKPAGANWNHVNFHQHVKYPSVVEKHGRGQDY